MEWINSGFGLLATVFGVVGLAGGAAGYFKASRGDSIIKYQAIEIEALRRKISDQDIEKTELESDKKAIEAKCATKDETIKKQEEHIKYLQKLGQGSPELKKMNANLANNTKTVESLAKIVEKLLKQEKKDAS